MARKEPRHSCPDIDRIKRTISDLIASINNCNVEDFESERDGWIGELENLGVGYRCELEEVRDINSNLREWGSDLNQENGELNNQISILENKISEQEDTISDLEDRLADFA